MYGLGCSRPETGGYLKRRRLSDSSDELPVAWNEEEHVVDPDRRMLAQTGEVPVVLDDIPVAQGDPLPGKGSEILLRHRVGLDFLCLFQRAHPAMLASPPACRKPENETI